MTSTSLNADLGKTGPPAWGETALVFFVSVVMLLLIKLPSLHEVPVWDGAMSVFPAAITLSDSHFDLPALLEAPTYAEAGPNVHALSLVTWITAGVLAAGGGLVPIHILHLVIGAGAATAIFRLAGTFLGKQLAAAATVAAMLSPLVLTQVGFMYLEVALLFATLMAVLAWSANRPNHATLWAVVAVLVKTSGIIVAAGLLLAELTARDRGRRDPVRIALRFGFPTLVFLLKLVLSPRTTIGTFTPMRGLLTSGGFLLQLPDLSALFAAYLFLALLTVVRTRGVPEGQEAISGVVGSFAAFYILFSALGGSTLPRYWTQIVPLLIIGVGVELRSRAPRKVVLAVFLLLAGVFAINRNGLLYEPVTGNNFAVAERSGEYRDLLALHQLGSASLDEAGASRDVFYSLPYEYFLSYPAMGYVNGVPLRGHSILHEEPYRQGRLQDLPESFAMLYEYSWLGGGIIKSVWEQAVLDPSRIVTVTQLQVGQYRSFLIEVDAADVSD